MADHDESALYATGLTEAEAKEVNRWWILSTFVYIAFAAVAHTAIWMWRPWFGTPRGYGELLEAGESIVNFFV